MGVRQLKMLIAASFWFPVLVAVALTYASHNVYYVKSGAMSSMFMRITSP